MRFIFRYAKNYKILLLLDLLGVLTFLLAELGIPTIIGVMIDNGVMFQDIGLIQRNSIILIAMAIVAGLGGMLLNFTSIRLSTNIACDIRRDFFMKTQEMGHVEYEKFGVSSLITRISSDVQQLQLFIQTLLRMGITSTLMMIGSGIFIYNTSVRLGIVILFSLPILLICVFYIAKRSHKLSTKQQNYVDKLNLITRENITGVRVIRAFRKDKDENSRFEAVNKDHREVSKTLGFLASLGEPIFYFVLNTFILVVAWVSTQLLVNNAIQVGQIAAFIDYQFHAMVSFLFFSVVVSMYPRAAVSIRRIDEVLNTEPKVRNVGKQISTLDQVQSISFNAVGFSYPGSESPLLKNISFSAEKGEIIAFIGSTGSGKSTIVKLLERFYDVTSGSITIDGVDIRDLDLDTLREQFGVVLQKAYLFKGTIADNIRYGKPDATLEEIKASLEISAALDFVEAKENQYDEPVSEGGLNLSGGQRQRISIARAVISKPEIYVFDDSFSALDYKTDGLIRRNLKPIFDQAIAIIVAQRISSVITANKIIVLNEGEIVGMGTHAELIKTCPIYIEIAKSQLSEKEMKQYEES